jgi:hypothetical protein
MASALLWMRGTTMKLMPRLRATSWNAVTAREQPLAVIQVVAS